MNEAKNSMSSSEWRDATLPEVQQVCNYLLSVFDQVTKKLDVEYMLTAGNLLGAVRSGGWIPWDDDMDVMMMRVDFERLRTKIAEHLPVDVEYSDPLFSDGHLTQIPRLMYRESKVDWQERFGMRPPERQKIALDIFILDTVPSNKLSRTGWASILRTIQIAQALRVTSRQAIKTSSEVGSRKQIALVAKGATSPFKRKTLARLYDRTASIFKNARSNRVALVNSGRLLSGETHPKSDFNENRTTVELDGKEYLSPDPQSFLPILYGPDYLTPPPKSERTGHACASVQIRGSVPKPVTPSDESDTPT